MGNMIGLLLGFLIKPASFPFLVKYTAYIPRESKNTVWGSLDLLSSLANLLISVLKV